MWINKYVNKCVNNNSNKYLSNDNNERTTITQKYLKKTTEGKWQQHKW